MIGIGTPPLQRIPEKTARRCFGALGVQKNLNYSTRPVEKCQSMAYAVPLAKEKHGILYNGEGAAGKRSAPSGDFAVCRRDCVRLSRFCLTGSSAHQIPAAGERRKAPQAPGQKPPLRSTEIRGDLSSVRSVGLRPAASAARPCRRPLRLQQDRAAVRLHDRLHDRQAEARAEARILRYLRPCVAVERAA